MVSSAIARLLPASVLPSRNALDAFKRRYKTTKVRRAIFPLMSFQVIEHPYEPERMLTQVRRHHDPGGCLS